jgi:glycosyltransferase involved in cell wall biosynthesis
MKIVLVVNSAWNIYNFRKKLISDLQQKGYEIHLVAPHDEYSERLIEMGFRFHPVAMSNKGTNPISDLLFLIRLFWLYKKIRPNVCLHYTIKPNIYGSMVASWLKIPVLNNITGLGTAFIRPGLVNKIVLRLYKLAFRNVFKVFFQNEDDRTLFLKYELVSADKTEVLPGSGVDLERFSPSNNVPETNTIHFLMIARILVDKGVLEYLNAAKAVKRKFPMANFTLLGAFDETSGFGVSRETVDPFILDGTITYKEFTDAIVDEIHTSDVVVLPSYREGTPKTLLEAAACGKPLLTTDAPGCKDLVIEGKNGYKCTVKSADDLERIMILFLQSSKENRLEMGKASRLLVEEKYDEKIVIRHYEAAIQQLEHN